MTEKRNSLGFVAVVVVTLILAGAASRASADEVWNKEPKGTNPSTGAPANAPNGCCCFPKLHPTASDAFDCKANMVEFDCKAECAQLKDGRDPSRCRWTKGDCPR